MVIIECEENVPDTGLNENRSLTILDNENNIIFNLIISKNNIIRSYIFKGNTAYHTFDEDYNYDVNSLYTWETFGKLNDIYINKLFDDNNALYRFYFQSQEVSLRFKYKDDQIAIEFESYDGECSYFAKFVTVKFSKEDTVKIKDALLTFCY